MKLTVVIVTLCLIAFATNLSMAELPSTFIKKDDAGNIVIQGVYTRDDSGKVLRYDVSNAEGKLLYTEIPYYAEDGRIIRGDRLSSEGSIDKVVVFFNGKAVILNAAGEVIETQPYSEK